MKAVKIAVIVFCMISALIFPITNYETCFGVSTDNISVQVNGSVVDFPDAKPVIDENNRTLVPVRFIAEALGAAVDWDETIQTAIIRNGDITVSLNLDSNETHVNGNVVVMDTKAIKKDERIFVPLRFVSELLNATVLWDQNIKTVSINTSGSDEQSSNDSNYDDQLKKNVKDFAAVNGGQTDMQDIGLTWGRLDFAWQACEPTKGNFNEEQLDKWKTMILDAKANGITILPVLDYTATWAADLREYSYNDFGKTYTYGPATVDTGKSDSCTRTVTVTNADGTVSGPETKSYRLSRQRFDVEEWENYVTKIVETFSAEPYNLQYFQIWNEAHPDSSFWYGGMDWYIENLHKTAAEIIKNHGCKVVYGGWPCCGSMGQFFGLLDSHNAWDSIDVFDVHYFPLSTMDSIYNAALKRGIKSPSVWQTEVAWVSQSSYIPSNYPRMFSWALNHRSDQKDQFKTFFFTWGSPNDPKAYGYNKVLKYTDGTVTDHGKAMRTFLNLLEGDNVERYTAVTSEPNLSDAVSGNSMQAFVVDGNKVVVSVGVNDVSLIQNMSMNFRGIYGFKSMRLINHLGEIVDEIEPTLNDNGGLDAVIPTDKITPVGTSYYFYVEIEAENVIAPTNNVKNFEFGSTSADNRSIIAAGRWSYLDGGNMPAGALSKGTGAGEFDATEWTVDDLNTQHTQYLDSSGNVGTDTRGIIYNYTVDRQQAQKDLVIKGTFQTYDSKKHIRILKTNDKSEKTVGSVYEVLYDYTGNTDQEINITVPAADVSYGNDVLFWVDTPEDGIPNDTANLNVTISVQQ